jgi:hypothetical protein
MPPPRLATEAIRTRPEVNAWKAAEKPFEHLASSFETALSRLLRMRQNIDLMLGSER